MKNRKTIYINESVLNRGLLKEASIGKKMPDAYENLASTGVFPFRKNGALPDFGDGNYCLGIINDEYQKAKDNILSLKTIDSIQDGSTIEQALAQMLNKIKEIEEPNRQKLEKMCMNRVIELFNIPDEVLTLDLKLVDNVDNSSSVLQIDPEASDLEYSDVSDAEGFSKEVNKRLIINMLIAGASIYYSGDISRFAQELFDVDPDLASLYKKTMIIDRYLLLSTPKVDITEKDKKIFGVTEVNLGNEDSKTYISTKAVNLFILLYETIKGLFELFASHGLPKEKYRAMCVIQKCDFVKAEPWNMRIGPGLWGKFMSACGDIESQKMPYLFMKVCSLTPSKFNILMKEVFAGTKKAKKMMKTISNNIEYEFFLDRMNKANTEKNVIEDEYINADEL